MNAIGGRLYELNFGRPQIAPRETIAEVLNQTAGTAEGHRFSPQFLLTEWEPVVDAWRLESLESYRDVARLGRRTRLKEAQRVLLWSMFERVRTGLLPQGFVSYSEIFSRVAEKLRESAHPPFEFALIDEAQDVSVPQLRFLAALGGACLNGLFLASDLGQRIFQQPFSWKALGVDVRGRSSTLRINYRTSHQIRMQADRRWAGDIRRGWQQGRTPGHGLHVQWSAAWNHGSENSGGRNQGCEQMACGPWQ